MALEINYHEHENNQITWFLNPNENKGMFNSEFRSWNKKNENTLHVQNKNLTIFYYKKGID
jgi:hypothetical protein